MQKANPVPPPTFRPVHSNVCPIRVQTPTETALQALLKREKMYHGYSLAQMKGIYPA